MTAAQLHTHTHTHTHTHIYSCVCVCIYLKPKNVFVLRNTKYYQYSAWICLCIAV